MTPYENLAARHRRMAHLRHVDAIASWDEATMMPEGGGDTRADALATLRVVEHELATDPALGELLAGARADAAAGKLTAWQMANLREMERAWVRETCLPGDLVQASARAELRSEQAWRKLRPQNDWRTFAPLLTEVVRLKREAAAALAARLGVSRYEALADGFEPGVRTTTLDALFVDLRGFLPTFIAEARTKQRLEAPVAVPAGPFPIESQRALGLSFMAKVGFDFRHGRLDTSHHPFCGGVPRDVRITTRYDEDDFAKSLMGVLHETGHAKYEQNLPAEWLDQPVGHARSMAVHESQSLFQEMQVSRSRELVTFAAPLIAAAFPEAARRQPRAFSPDNLRRLYTRVTPGLIRVDADEATYPCHVILRYEIERPLIDGALEVADIPDAWDERMRDLLGLDTRGNFKDGCMQDVHWPAGLFGYFPSYTLGALLAAQLFDAAESALPNLRGDIARGQFVALDGWLRERIWSQGSFLETDALVLAATGEPLGTGAFRRHLHARYLA
jgi:carboxypeptidase Taq